MKIKKKNEKGGISLIGIVILLAIIAFATVIIYWAYGLSEVVNERAKEQEKLDYMGMINSSIVTKE